MFIRTLIHLLLFESLSNFITVILYEHFYDVIRNLPCKFVPKFITLDPSLYILKKISLYINVNWTKT